MPRAPSTAWALELKQLSQVENFISQKVDAIIVNPVDTASTDRITKAAVAAGIPLIYVNRRPDQTDLPKGVVTVTSRVWEYSAITETVGVSPVVSTTTISPSPTVTSDRRSRLSTVSRRVVTR